MALVELILMSRKSIGINAERSLIALFWQNNWAAHRIAGSGSSRYPSPDILAGNGVRRLAIECKSTKSNSKYLGKDEIEQLKLFSSMFGAEPWLAVKFDQWYFLTMEDLKETNKSFMVSQNHAKNKGLLIEELVSL